MNKAVGKLATKVYKYNKRGIDVHFLNQQPGASISLKVSEVLPGQAIPIRADVKPAIAADKVKNQKTVRRDNTVLWTTNRGSAVQSL